MPLLNFLIVQSIGWNDKYNVFSFFYLKSSFYKKLCYNTAWWICYYYMAQFFVYCFKIASVIPIMLKPAHIKPLVLRNIDYFLDSCIQRFRCQALFGVFSFELFIRKPKNIFLNIFVYFCLYLFIRMNFFNPKYILQLHILCLFDLLVYKYFCSLF